MHLDSSRSNGSKRVYISAAPEAQPESWPFCVCLLTNTVTDNPGEQFGNRQENGRGRNASPS